VGELAEFHFEALHRFQGADGMAVEEMPDGDAELARDCDRRFVAAASC